MTHELKVRPEYFDALASGAKPFEVRRDDRTPRFEVGDAVVFREWQPGTSGPALRETGWSVPVAVPGSYTGRRWGGRITYVLRGFEGLAPGYCALGLVAS